MDKKWKTNMVEDLSWSVGLDWRNDDEFVFSLG